MSSNRKAVLGRGLNALLNTRMDEDAPEGEIDDGGMRNRMLRIDDRARQIGRIAELEVESIRPNPYQPRKNFDEKTLDELAASIVQLGIIQPLTVRSLGQNRYEIISGERRLRAARRAGLKLVPAYIREADTEEMLEMALVENVQREELNPVEVALGYQRLIEECGLTQEQVAQKVGKNRATVANSLRLLKLPARVQASLRDNHISAGHARALVNVEEEAVQIEMLKRIEAEGASVREVEEWVRAWHQARERADERPAAPEEPAKALLPDRNALELQRYADALRSRLSTQVSIRHKSDANGGKIEITYYSADDLERLMEMLGT
ncbi:MAG TPA: ParB/RepB/Spo0J family partition protein [Rhodothermales bacterium]|nr:ParB/RepB/Spo0J family partition protein [Rhodothermales bacterium]